MIVDRDRRGTALWRNLFVGVSLVLSLAACGEQAPKADRPPEVAAKSGPPAQESASAWHSGARADSLIRPNEKHFKALYQITNGGENAEAYFSWDGSQLILQITPREGGCDQIYTVPVRGGSPVRISNGLGRCTCAYFFPGDQRVVYSSTHLSSAECPPRPDYSRGYVWPIYPGYDVFAANADGSDPKPLTTDPGYDAEATVGADGTIVFASMRGGDLDIYTMDADGRNVRRLTDAIGYDGGAFFSADGNLICFRAYHPTAPEEIADYHALLAEGLIRPGELDLFVMNRDGSNKRRLTSNEAANFGPFFHPSGQRIIFSSNLENPRGRNFDLYLIDIDGSNLERVTFEETFDGFPMFSPDGKLFVFASNRGAEREGETNIFLAEWVE